MYIIKSIQIINPIILNKLLISLFLYPFTESSGNTSAGRTYSSKLLYTALTTTRRGLVTVIFAWFVIVVNRKKKDQKKPPKNVKNIKFHL